MQEKNKHDEHSFKKDVERGEVVKQTERKKGKKGL
jgi:hypothetical protein